MTIKKLVFYCLALVGVMMILQSAFFAIDGCDKVMCLIYATMGLLFSATCVAVAHEDKE